MKKTISYNDLDQWLKLLVIIGYINIGFSLLTMIIVSVNILIRMFI